jgi:hypothetical protein
MQELTKIFWDANGAKKIIDRRCNYELLQNMKTSPWVRESVNCKDPEER